MTYAEFLAAKQRQVGSVGPEITEADVSPVLFGWQQQIVTWATRKGRAAIWATTGAGKTLMQIEWARLSADTSLIVAPLAVCQQTVREASKLGLTATYVRGAEQVTGPGVWVTNYEMVTHFDPSLGRPAVLPMKLVHFSSADEIHPTPSEQDPEPRYKPRGLWVSDESAEESWSWFCRSEEFRDLEKQNAFEIALAPDARILTLSTVPEILDFDRNYGEDWPLGRLSASTVCWPKVAGDWSGILISPYQWQLRLELSWYYGWDVASGCIWDPAAIASVEILTPVR